MKKSTFNYIVDILREYPHTTKYIKKRMDELKYPERSDDINSDIRGSKTEHDPHINWMIKLEQDRRLRKLEQNYLVINNLLNECDRDTYTIINELYLKRYPKYKSVQELVNNNVVTIGKSKAYELRDEFFNYVASDLDL